MSWTLRTGRLSDAGPALLLLWAESDAEPTRTDDVKSLQRPIVHDPAALIAAEEDGSLVGTVIARLHLDMTVLGRQQDCEEPMDRVAPLRGCDPTFTS
jgi:hypothetical protein